MTYSLWVGNGYIDESRNTMQGIRDVETCAAIIRGHCYIQYHGGQMEQVLDDGVEISYFCTVEQARAAVSFLRADGINGAIAILSDDDGKMVELETIAPVTEPEQKEEEAAEQEADRLNKELEGKTMTNTMTDNQKHCKSIADSLEQIAEGRLYICPECGEYIEPQEEPEEGGEEWPDVTRTICPECGQEIEDPESVSMLDFFQDCYNIEYRIDSNGEYKSVEVMVACGGPNIFVDTKTAAVELYWWGDRADWHLSREAVNAIDDAFEELWACR